MYRNCPCVLRFYIEACAAYKRYVCLLVCSGPTEEEVHLYRRHQYRIAGFLFV